MGDMVLDLIESHLDLGEQYYEVVMENKKLKESNETETTKED
jgi:hypothetical protein